MESYAYGVLTSVRPPPQIAGVTSRQARERIAAYMKERRITQGKLAERLSTTQSKVSKILGGQNKLSLDAFVLICEALQLEPCLVIGAGRSNSPEAALIDDIRKLTASRRDEVQRHVGLLLAEQRAERPPSTASGG